MSDDLEVVPDPEDADKATSADGGDGGQGGRTGTTLGELEALAEDLRRRRDEALATQPEELRQPDPQTPIPVEGYRVSHSALEQIDGFDKAGKPRYRTVLSGRSLELLAHVVEGGSVVAVRALISFGERPGRPYDIPSSVASGNRNKGAEELFERTGQPWTPEQVGVVGRWLTRASTTGAPAIKVVSTVRWSGNWLLLPGVNALGRGTDYGIVEGGAANARRVWHEVVAAGERHPRFAIFVGAAMIAPFIGRLGLDVRGFIANVYGNQNSGKTESLRTACAAFGIPREDHLLRDWRGTGNALLVQVADNGILPVFMDDTSKITVDRPGDADKVIEEMAYAVSGGRDKARLFTDGTLRAAATFETVVLSTSEAPILSAGKSGMVSRVVEIKAPLIDEGGAAESARLQRRLEDLATRHCGWPLRWVLQGGMEIDDARDILRRPEYAYVQIGDPLERTARNVAACALGWNILAVATEYPERPTGEELGKAVFAEFAEHAQTVGISQEERLWAELPGFVLANARRIEGMGAYEGGSGDVIGRWWKETGNVALIPRAVKDLAREMGLGDPATALSGLAKDERLQRDSQDKLQVSVRIAGTRVRAYVFEGLLPQESEEGSVSP